MAAKRSRLDDLEQIHIQTRTEWRAWLTENHRDSKGVWLVTFKKPTGKPRIDYDEAVEELICFGWIDSLPRALDDERSMLLCTPRKPTSKWSKLNKDRVERMERAKQMTAAGRAAVKTAQANGAWDALNDVEALVIPSDLDERFQAYPDSKANFEGFPKSVKRGILEWILQAKKPKTRAKRIEETARQAGQNERANQWKRKA